MQFGIYIFATEHTMPVVDVARAAEDRGFESMFLPEHTHIPASRESPYPFGDELADEYRRTYDPFVALAAAAAVTERIRLGTGICLVVQRDPIVLAKEVATLDQISNGRVVLGVGAGWNKEEMRNHGTDPSRRMTVLRERVEAMKTIWRDEEASYDGEFVSFDRIWAWPKPVQQPHPPIVVGGNADKSLDRVVAYGDEWMPSDPRDNGVLGRQIDDLQQRAAAAGRERIPVSVFAARPYEHDVEGYASVGVDRCVFWLPPSGADDVLSRLDRYAAVARSFA